MSAPRTEHETVGWRFKSWGGIYLCTRYQRSAGFWMRLVEADPADVSCGRKVGGETCVSERAIGRTFHLDHKQERPEAHEQPCECYVCVPREQQ